MKYDLVINAKKIITMDESNPTATWVAVNQGKIAAIGSGGNYALAAARALMQNTDLSAREIAEKALHIAASICVYTNDNVIVEEV